MSNFSIRRFNKGLGDRLWTRTKTSNDAKNYCARFQNSSRDGNKPEPTFTEAIMKTMTRLEQQNRHPQLDSRSRKRILSESLSQDKISIPTTPIQVLKKINYYPTISSSSENIVMAVTLVESKYKVYKQVELLTAMLKSLVALSTGQEPPLTLIILTDKESSCEKIYKRIPTWNDGGKMRLDLECIVANYTKGMGH